MSLLKLANITLNSGIKSDFKIECDALTDEDIECAAYLISKMGTFNEVKGVPTGGLRLAEALKKYRTGNTLSTYLIVDDVLTTGGSMEKMRDPNWPLLSRGAVIFARGECPPWIKPLFQLNPQCY